MANWIAKATARHKGSFARAARRAHVSTSAYARKVTKTGSRASTTMKRRANLAKTLSKLRRRR